MMLRSAALKIGTPILLVACWATTASAQPAAPARPKILVYGNYCGPGNNAPLAPIDALDAACARHDECTPNRGLPTKACNLRLEREARAIAVDPRQSQELRSMAGVVAAFAAGSPSKSAPDVAPEAVAVTAAAIIMSALR